ncbi:MaoC/PaaZ C-terminal domain-containing protein [Rossellomorea sp. YZS02]|uniref:MaoC/PaaZ C-terminal domain-containing protein n=1 Tax=Rossellomorea sp. YZS02 TaxID=3097358 RepID=UPI002A16B23B|nr:MaoC/PaaZ C-terminal domain-containing protein [Rossellomorea sp. YZS02]MDX8344381.1 MaoC/PaaZ C-terminal domain-containing protein [Rossellomorea sp. YZS02]
MTTPLSLHVGAKLPPVELDPVSRIDLIKYAGASGDYNPIHTIDDEALKLGLPGIIAHGMWTMGNVSKLFSPFHEEGFIKDYSVRFKGMVMLDDVITLRAEMLDRQDNLLHFNVTATNQAEKTVIEGKVVFELIS